MRRVVACRNPFPQPFTDLRTEITNLERLQFRYWQQGILQLRRTKVVRGGLCRLPRLPAKVARQFGAGGLRTQLLHHSHSSVFNFPPCRHIERLAATEETASL